MVASKIPNVEVAISAGVHGEQGLASFWRKAP